MTRLSVIIPCYNVATYVPATVRSLLRSADDDVEFIFVNDCSTDTTGEVLDATFTTLPNARVVHNEVNRGLSGARNVGVEAAPEADYYAFLDGDDYVAPGYYPKLHRTIADLGVDMVRVDHVKVTGRKRTVHRVPHPRNVVDSPRNGILPVDGMSSVDFPNAWSGVFHRTLADQGLLEFNEDLRTCEDRPWNWRLHLRAETFAVAGLLGVHYRRDVSTSLTRISDSRQFDFLKACDGIVADVLADPEADRFLPKALRSYCALVCHHLNRLDTYEKPLATTLRSLCSESLRALPRTELKKVIAGMDHGRRHTLTKLLEGR